MIRAVADGGAAPPVNYQPPVIAWLVEYTDDRQPGWQFQAGAFVTEVEARKLLCGLNKTGWYGDLSINMVPVHQTIQDWGVGSLTSPADDQFSSTDFRAGSGN